MSKTQSSKAKTNSKRSLNNPNPGRTRPMIPKDGYTQNRRRYDNGGEFSYCY